MTDRPDGMSIIEKAKHQIDLLTKQTVQDYWKTDVSVDNVSLRGFVLVTLETFLCSKKHRNKTKN